MALCGLYALIGFPLDDVWHRIFGQDVTLWGPTHLMLIGGAGLSLIAVLLLEHEGNVAMGADAPPPRRFIKFLQYLSFGGLVHRIGGVPDRVRLRRRAVPAGAAADADRRCGREAAVAARMVLGRGAASIAALWRPCCATSSIDLRPVLGAPTSWFALYLGPALVVELIALTPLIKRPLLFGAIGGLGVGTVGLWLESLWIDAVYRYPGR